MINPYWVEDSKNLGRGEIDYLSGAEVQFWKDLIDKYLFPLDADSKKQVTFKLQPWVDFTKVGHRADHTNCESIYI